MKKTKAAIEVAGVFITDPAASPKDQLKARGKLKSWKKLSKVDQFNRMNDALNTSGDRLREFIEQLSNELGVPYTTFSFWLLQQESYVDFNHADLEVREYK